MTSNIPEVVILRLPLYARVLRGLADRGEDVVSSQRLGDLLHSTPAQIRKDLSYFGRFGKQGRGYRVDHLLRELRQIMGLERQWSVILVGVGQLGKAILTYGGFAPQGFHVVAAFDSDQSLVGTSVGSLTVQASGELAETVKQHQPQLAIVAVPGHACQSVVDMVVRAGIKGILNYAPHQAQVPEGVWVRDIDPVGALQSITYYLKPNGS
ncbi:MAG: redox-sensing transcriptional repressor Rex [Dehalococcoidia bacterium]|nr:redox-sensing transcriptional repressor Rex [Dehalococcoidia bacterium]